MTSLASTAGVSAGEVIQQLAHELLLSSGEIAARISEQVLVRLPGLAPRGAQDAVDGVREATDQNIGAILSTLAFGIPATATEPPLGARKLMRASVAAGADITDLLRAYRYGHELIWRRWSDHAAERLSGNEILADVLALSSDHMFTFIDRSCDHLLAEYRTEFGALRPSGLRRSHSEVVRDLIGDDQVDEIAAGATLQHDVRGHHVALVLAPLDATADLRAALTDLACLGDASTLVLPVGDGTWWAWMTWAGAPDTTCLDAMAGATSPGVLVAMGAPGAGRQGFRRSHHQAREADRTARLSGRPAMGVVRFRDVELSGLLCTDTERARRLAADRLGGLAGVDETCRRLRETVLTFVEHGCSKARTAELLHVHHKTVSYRLAQAEELVGQRITDDVVALGAALVVHQTLGDC
ncbi:PucR family transcriptional regulator [Actinomycetospora sp.]|uniref:PucR family transcriptional regulator n=1 Tax=Actinomycetospora sp. TaxID=1872135 RepID=UPI002F3F53A1